MFAQILDRVRIACVWACWMSTLLECFVITKALAELLLTRTSMPHRSASGNVRPSKDRHGS